MITQPWTDAITSWLLSRLTQPIVIAQQPEFRLLTDLLIVHGSYRARPLPAFKSAVIRR